MKIRQILFSLLCAMFLMPSNTVLACSVCFGDPNSKLTQGIGWGIWVLMGFIGSVLMLFALLFLKIRARMKNLSAGIIQGKA